MKHRFTSLTDTRQVLCVTGLIILVFSGIILFTFYCDKIADMYLLPDGFKGTAKVIFADPEGLGEQLNGDKRIFDIPASGILHTQSVYKRKQNNYYFKKPNGELQQIMYGNPGVHMGGTVFNFDSIWVRQMDVAKIVIKGRERVIGSFAIEHTH